jgi:hypothetical protein
MLRALSLTSVIGLAGCSGARTELHFDGLRHPVSMSPVISPGRPIDPGSYRGRFECEARAYSLLYSAISLDPVTDLSPLIEAEIERLGGDAVVELTVSASTCPMNHFVPLTLLPMWPNCVHLRVTGLVIGDARGSEG